MVGDAPPLEAERPRPPEKPNFIQPSASAYPAWSVPPVSMDIEKLTLMREGPWMEELNKGYRQSHPIEADQILRGMRTGLPIDFEGDRTVSRTCTNLKSALEPPEVEQKVHDIICGDTAGGKTAGPFEHPPFPVFSCSPIGAVPKRGSTKVRKIHHLSFPRHGDSINGSTKDVYQALGSFEQAKELVRRLGKGCWLIKLDVEAAYRQVPVRPEDWPLLGFKWRGQYYFDRTLPFGLKSSCRLWELYASALHFMCETTLGVPCVVHYIDDFLFVVQELSAAQKHLRDALALCLKLGLPMAVDKTEGPTHCLTFLGIELDTEKMEARLGADRLTELLALLAAWENKSHASIKDRERLAGILNFASCVIKPGRTYLARILQDLRGLKRSKDISSSQLATPIGAGTRADLRWWRAFVSDWNGVHLLYERDWERADKLQLFTDACGSGYGGYFQGRWFKGEWSPEDLAIAQRERSISMPYLELRALVLAAVTFAAHWKGLRIIFRCDCQPAVEAVGKGTSQDPGLASLLRLLHTTAARGQFECRAVWIQGSSNDVADVLSRMRVSDSQEVARVAESKFRHLCPEADLNPTLVPQLPPLNEM